MHNHRISSCLSKILKKLQKRDKVSYEQILKKIETVIFSSDIEHYKNLRYNLKDYKRVHIGHFVLVFSYDKEIDCITFEDFNHHDVICKHRYYE